MPDTQRSTGPKVILGVGGRMARRGIRRAGEMLMVGGWLSCEDHPSAKLTRECHPPNNRA